MNRKNEQSRPIYADGRSPSGRATTPPLSPEAVAFGAPLRPWHLPYAELGDCVSTRLRAGGRLGLFTARQETVSGRVALVLLVLDTAHQSIELWETLPDTPDGTFHSLTPQIPQAHWFERAISDFFGLTPLGHPRLKSLILHEAWPAEFYPLREPATLLPEDIQKRRDYRFMTVRGEGVYEIPVGPIHAGIIEPGHFRFSCLGEVIQNLEIRLGYQHRGVEQHLTRIPWQRARFVAEAASSDTSAGNAWAHAMAIEHLLGITPPQRAAMLRALALEIERIASHLGDLGGICNDIGFAAGATTFSILRGQALGLGEQLTGARFLTGYIIPGGVASDLFPPRREAMSLAVQELAAAFLRALPLLLENAGALERMEGTGIVRPSLARDFGLVGPAGRASGVAYDVRRALQQAPYHALPWDIAVATEGDVLARVRIRIEETRTSLALLQTLLASLPEQGAYRMVLPATLPPQQAGVGIVEAWRGELIHLVMTDATGRITRYCIKDPSFNNWTGLAIAARGQLVADFPLCNKSFGLSYSGNDL